MKKLLFLAAAFSTGLAATAQMNITVQLQNGQTFVHENVSQIAFSQTSVSSSHDYVDLGLPSGTLWATCNVGAGAPEEYGDFFAWGEVEPKINKGYSWATYKWMKEGESRSKYITKYQFADDMTSGCWYNNDFFIGDGMTELEAADDAATVNWGDDWQTPSYDQIAELENADNTTSVWTAVNGVLGRMVYGTKTGYTDKCIFLPATGDYEDDSHNGEGNYGRYWSRSLSHSYSDYSYILEADNGSLNKTDRSRCNGSAVRPVRK